MDAFQWLYSDTVKDHFTNPGTSGTRIGLRGDAKASWATSSAATR